MHSVLSFAAARKSMLSVKQALLTVFFALLAGIAFADDHELCMHYAEPEVAIPACQRVLKTRNVIRKNALNNLSAALRHNGELDKAYKVINEAIELDPSYSSAWINRASIREEWGDFEGALKDANEGIRLSPDRANGYNIRGSIYFELGDRDRCLSDHNRVVSLLPGEAIAYSDRSMCYRLSGEYDRALKDLNTAIRLDPKWGHPYSLRADIFRLQGNLDRSLQDHTKAIQLAADSSLTYILRGDTYRYKGLIELALADYDKALRIAPKSPIPALTGRGLALEKKGDLEGAKAAFSEAVKTVPDARADITRSSLETAKAHLAALASGAEQPVIPPVPGKLKETNSVPTPQIRIPQGVAASNRLGRRVALVFGNSGYRKAPELANPRRDAQAVANALRAIGFASVTVEIDDTRERMLTALRKFAAEAEGADWAMVYYAGHGIEMGGTNYLVPIDAELSTDRDVQFEALSFDQIMLALEGAKKLKLVLLDACRDNPFEVRPTTAAPVATLPARAAVNGSRSIGRGLAEVKVSGATLVVFAAKQGQVALDGDGEDSPFAVAVVQRLASPGIEINKLFRLVRDDVMEATAGRQEPYTYGSLPGKEDFFFVEK